MKKRILAFIGCLLALLPLSLIYVSAGSYAGPQDLHGLQTATITHYYGDSFTFYDTVTSGADTVRTTAYSTGIDLADLIVDQNPGTNTKIRLYFHWDASQKMVFNEIFFQNLPLDFRIAATVSGKSAMTGATASIDLAYVDQQSGWYRYDNYSHSSTMIPFLSYVTDLIIVVDGGSAHLSTLADDDIILSVSALPYSLSLSADLQYNQGYRDAQKVYSDNLQTEKQNSYDAGVLKGYSDGYNNAQSTLVPEAYQAGKDDGYIIGKNDGLEISQSSDLRQLIFAIPEAHLTALEGFTNWELLGYNLYDLLGGIVVLVVVAVIVKIGLKFVL